MAIIGVLGIVYTVRFCPRHNTQKINAILQIHMLQVGESRGPVTSLLWANGNSSECKWTFLGVSLSQLHFPYRSPDSRDEVMDKRGSGHGRKEGRKGQTKTNSKTSATSFLFLVTEINALLPSLMCGAASRMNTWSNHNLTLACF